MVMKQWTFRFWVVLAAGLMLGSGCARKAQETPNQVSLPPSFMWSGDVDADAIVHIQHGKTWIEDVSGKPTQNIVSKFQGKLPDDYPVTVQFTSTSGRGQVVLTQQPTEENNYITNVQISDPQPGAGHYQFTLTW